jgi:hypothetical protein
MLAFMSTYSVLLSRLSPRVSSRVKVEITDIRLAPRTKHPVGQFNGRREASLPRSPCATERLESISSPLPAFCAKSHLDFAYPGAPTAATSHALVNLHPVARWSGVLVCMDICIVTYRMYIHTGITLVGRALQVDSPPPAPVG